MSLLFYKVLHLVGIIMLFAALGGAIVRAVLAQQSPKLEKFVLMNHGLALLIILIAGFGQLAKIGMTFAGWVIVKMFIWLIMGALILPIKKKPELNIVWWITALVLGTVAAIMGVYKPF
ncbi:MAG: hypothetical protein H6627_02925 [Calditrichae bacterium]|nr:hypothetical protein [Calditrichota bacterium]MCB9057489.1 hypothetical protein [Calditrichia bacterium]